jgi:hypothetical protein
MLITALPEAISNYGIISRYEFNRGRRFTFAPPYRDVYILHITLLYPHDCPIPADDREVRTELYLQAESIMEILRKNNFQLAEPPRIVLSGVSDRVEGTLEVQVMEG